MKKDKRRSTEVEFNVYSTRRKENKEREREVKE